MQMPLGISTWSLNGLAPAGLDHVLDGAHYLPEHGPGVRRFADEMADAILTSKLRSVELWHNWALYDDDVLLPFMRLADAGLVGSMHAPFGPAFDISSLTEDVRRAGVAACRKAAGMLYRLGGDVLTVHGGIATNDPSQLPLRTAQTVLSLTDLADFCKPLGIRVALEIIVGRVVGNSGSEVLAILAQVDRPNVGACIDVNHVFPPPALVPTVREIADRIFTLHISDYDGLEEKHWLPGRGVIDWRALIDALEDVGYTGPFPYEVRFEAPTIRETVEGIERNYEELNVL